MYCERLVDRLPEVYLMIICHIRNQQTVCKLALCPCTFQYKDTHSDSMKSKDPETPDTPYIWCMHGKIKSLACNDSILHINRSQV